MSVHAVPLDSVMRPKSEMSQMYAQKPAEEKRDKSPPKVLLNMKLADNVDFKVGVCANWNRAVDRLRVDKYRIEFVNQPCLHIDTCMLLHADAYLIH
jgi:hypothetical protein